MSFKIPKTQISYRPMKPGEETGVIDFLMEVFNEFVAPRYSKEGVAEFEKFVRADALADRFKAGNLVILAESEGRIVGVIEVRENSHVALLFVKRSHQHRGIAKELFRRSIDICRKRNPEIRKFTVNSSPNAFSTYQKFGFISIENEKVVNGIRFIPMEFVLDNNDSNN